MKKLVSALKIISIFMAGMFTTAAIEYGFDPLLIVGILACPVSYGLACLLDKMTESEENTDED